MNVSKRATVSALKSPHKVGLGSFISRQQLPRAQNSKRSHDASSVSSRRSTNQPKQQQRRRVTSSSLSFVLARTSNAQHRLISWCWNIPFVFYPKCALELWLIVMSNSGSRLWNALNRRIPDLEYQTTHGANLRAQDYHAVGFSHNPVKSTRTLTASKGVAHFHPINKGSRKQVPRRSRESTKPNSTA